MNVAISVFAEAEREMQDDALRLCSSRYEATSGHRGVTEPRDTYAPAELLSFKAFMRAC